MTSDEDYRLWIQQIHEARLPVTARSELLNYVERLSSSSVPVIVNLRHLAELTGLQASIVAAAAFSTPHFYRTFSIPKRSGGRRTIQSPLPVLLSLQRWIVSDILASLEVHDAAHGFVCKRSIITNATQHVGRRCLLKLDISDFFPSISYARILAIFLSLGYTKEVGVVLASLCCLDERLPQGAATSPTLSNLVAKSLDQRLASFAREFDLVYSRYADDMTFSGDEIDVWHQSEIAKIVADEGFKTNLKKTVLIRGAGKKVVTGISISRGRLALPRDAKREIRRKAHYLVKNGIVNESFRGELRDPIYVDRILGSLRYWSQIEPSNPFPREASQQIGNLLVAMR